MIVLGLNGVDGIFHDASASLVVDGRVVASVEEERFNRRKHSNGVPLQAIAYCLRKANLSPSDIDAVGYYLDPDILEETLYTQAVERFGADPARIGYYRTAADNIRKIPEQLRASFPGLEGTPFHFLNHHDAHAASAFFISGFETAAVLTIDGAGERESCVLYTGGPEGIRKCADLRIYPYSLGFIYTLLAEHLGLGWVEGPGKLMGLAAYGAPRAETFAGIVSITDDPLRPVEIDLSFFDYHTGFSGLSAKGLAHFGPPRQAGQPLEQTHFDLAASTQDMLEQAVLAITRAARTLLPQHTNLCLSGGIGLNVKANRKIKDSGLFQQLFVPPFAYDGGTSLGCALLLEARQSGRYRYAFDVYAGPDIEADFDIEAACRSFGEQIVWRRLEDDILIETAAACLERHALIGWAQGRMECGPRALGHRSLLANPTSPQVKDQLNTRVKKREGFRPYAPSVLAEDCAQWFDLDSSPLMLLEASVLPEKRALVPGIVHVDGSSRPQTVERDSNPRYHALLSAFKRLTGVPLVLNTSYNRHGEPVVNSPEDAIAVLLDTDLDDIFIGNFHIRRAGGV